MNIPDMFYYFGIAILSGIVLALICALFAEQINEIIGNFFALWIRPLYTVQSSLAAFWRGTGEFYHEQFSVDGNLDLQKTFYQFIGAVLYMIFFLVFIFSEFHLLALSLVAVGVDVGHFTSPIGAGTLTALAIISSVLFWGAVICDLSGITNTAPWRDVLNDQWKKYLLIVTLIALGITLFITISMGLLRGKIIAEESFNNIKEAQTMEFKSSIRDLESTSIPDMNHSIEKSSPEPPNLFYNFIPIFANVCIPILVFFGGIASTWGVVSTIKFFMLTAAFIIILPLGILLLISNLCLNIIERLYQLAIAIFQLFVAMGTSFLSLFGWKPSQQNATQNNNSDEQDDNNHLDDGSDSFDDPYTGSTETDKSQDNDTVHPSKDGWDPFKE